MVDRSLHPLLMVWFSPGFPVGAYAYSHGLELAASRGWITDRVSLEGWIGALLEIGSIRNDLMLLSEAWNAAQAGDAQRLAACNALALALSPSAERHLETLTQGNAFVAAIKAAWPHPALPSLWQELDDYAYPVAVGAAASAHSVALVSTLYAYALAFVSNLASAAIRLSVIGQTDAQRLLANLMAQIEGATDAAMITPIEHLGSAVMRADLGSMLHETQYSRLFRS